MWKRRTGCCRNRGKDEDILSDKALRRVSGSRGIRIILLTVFPFYNIIIFNVYGGIAQLARAHGSYPWCRRFESCSRYFFIVQMICVIHFYVKRNFDSAGGDVMRIGNGYDVHRLIYGRKLILGGVEVPYEKGLLGHSDADVLTHAVMDALLGAAALGDIGKHFPDTDPDYEGADSIQLLREVGAMLRDRAYFIENIDTTIIAQRPKLQPYILKMRQTMADALGISPEQINIKATTEEGLGFTGEGHAMAAHAVCLLSEIQNYVGIDVMTQERNCDICPGCPAASEDFNGEKEAP